jgi:hypothetical protein
LQSAFLDAQTNLDGCIVANEEQVGPRLADIRWGDASLIGVRWQTVKTLADEHAAKQRKDKKGKRIAALDRTSAYEAAGRAYRLLSTTLRS